MPAYNKQPARIMAALEVIHADLGRLGVADDFDLFILSDTTDPDAWIAEEATYLATTAATPVPTGPCSLGKRAGSLIWAKLPGYRSPTER